MKKQWLYNKDGGTLFKGENEIKEAFENGYVDSPAKVEVEDNENILPNGLSVFTVDELKEKFTIKQLKFFCVDLGIEKMSNKPEQIVAEALFNHFNKG